jgi:hypothetical protein
MFNNCNAPIPYWYEYTQPKERNKIIDAYQLEKELPSNHTGLIKKLKI